MKNRIDIEFNRGIYKAFWNNERTWKPPMCGAPIIRYHSRLIFVANTRDLAEKRAKDFIELHPGIEGYVFL